MKKERLYQLDLIRFLAAMYVVLYHYCFRGFNKDNFSTIQFETLENFAKYGYLGVDLFFMISGFVILMSAINSNISKFITSRISRLYPAYWICLGVTSLVISLWGHPIFFISQKIFLANLTMLNGFFNFEYVDGVYWSLLVELKFYILISIILLLKKIKYLKWFIYGWLTLSFIFLFLSVGKWNIFLSALNYLFIPSWSSYFVAGMLFYISWKEKNIKKNILPLVLTYALSLIFAYKKYLYLNDAYHSTFSFYIIAVMISFFYLIFTLLTLRKLNSLNKSTFLKLGMTTYPLYLLHQNIGYIAFNKLGIYVNKYYLLISLILFFVFLSYFISKKIEKPIAIYLKIKLSKLLNNKK